LNAEPYPSDEGPALILGPYTQNGNVRRFWFHDRILFWTGLLEKAAAQRNAAQPLYRLTVEQIERAKENLKLANRLQPKTPPPPPVVTVRRGWVEDTLHCLEMLPRVEKLFKPPPANVPLADVLLVRATLIRSDDASGEDEEAYGSHGKAASIHLAANRFAARYVGLNRRERLREYVLTLIVTLDKRLDGFLHEGSLWAASRHATLEAELAELRSEVAELKTRRTK
jgi:hypothetical protein